jgi:hypothetical protein
MNMGGPLRADFMKVKGIDSDSFQARHGGIQRLMHILYHSELVAVKGNLPK